MVTQLEAEAGIVVKILCLQLYMITDTLGTRGNNIDMNTHLEKITTGILI